MYKYAYKFGGIVFKYLIEGGGGWGEVGGIVEVYRKSKNHSKNYPKPKNRVRFRSQPKPHTKP